MHTLSHLIPFPANLKKTEMTTINFSHGFCEVITSERFVSKRYFGDYENRELQNKANTGLWYTVATGFPVCYNLEGEAGTPEESVQDLKDRAAALRDKLNQFFAL